jgi:cytochrome c peroxidase
MSMTPVFASSSAPRGTALNGRTPDEMYFGQAEETPAKLAAARKLTRAQRLAANRTLSCEACVAPGQRPSAVVSAA